ncbi:hypothetical protein GCM10023176_10160 [Micromonospora coerulea]|uniref:Uncharacterized protein n=1 Tax=Micromonospora coerulea TaxID=47856 RepID=A0ABP8SAY3_9ACTN
MRQVGVLQAVDRIQRQLGRVRRADQEDDGVLVESHTASLGGENARIGGLRPVMAPSGVIPGPGPGPTGRDNAPSTNPS